MLMLSSDRMSVRRRRIDGLNSSKEAELIGVGPSELGDDMVAVGQLPPGVNRADGWLYAFCGHTWEKKRDHYGLGQYVKRTRVFPCGITKTWSPRFSDFAGYRSIASSMTGTTFVGFQLH